MSFTDRVRNGWNAFMGRDPTRYYPNYEELGMGNSYRPDRTRLSVLNERSIVTTIYNRIAMDVANCEIQHVRLDENNRYIATIDSGLNNALTLDANTDQTGRAFIQDVVLSMFDEGCVAIVPTDTTISPILNGSYDIQTLRTAQILEWYPYNVKVKLYNENKGEKEEIILPKKMIAIIENPFYAVMNESNSTLQRLIRTLNRLDRTDEQNASGKLDLIIQLPYVIKTDARRVQAENRRKEIENQLIGSKYGIAYTDGTERITQLNRAVENNLWTQASDLTAMLYQQLGIDESILNGTAEEQVVLNYYDHTVNPILTAICDEMKRKFLTKTARTQGQSIKYFRDPFKIIPVTQLAEIADKLTRNEIASSNEIRSIIGWKPSDDPEADELRNKNLNKSENDMTPGGEMMPEEGMMGDEYGYYPSEDEEIAAGQDFVGRLADEKLE